MHLQPRPKSASGASSASSAGFKGLYSPYGFLPEKMGVQDKPAAFVQLFDKKNTSTQPLRSVSGPGSSRALVSFSNGNGTNSAATSMMKIESLEMELDSTKAKLSSEHEICLEFQKQVDALTSTLIDLKEQLKSKSWAMVEKDRNLKEIEYKNECMAEEGQAMIEDMKIENMALGNEIKELRQVVVSWERRWDQAETAMDESEEQLRHAEKRNENTELKMNECRLELKKSKILIEEKEIENATLRKRNSDLENQIVTMSKKNREDLDSKEKDRISVLMEQVNNELCLLRTAREEAQLEEASPSSRTREKVPSNDSSHQETESSWRRHQEGSSAAMVDMGEAIGESLARRLPKEMVDQLKQPLVDAVIEAVSRGRRAKSGRSKPSRVSDSQTGSVTSSIGTNEAIFSDSTIATSMSRGSFRGQLPRLNSDEEDEVLKREDPLHRTVSEASSRNQVVEEDSDSNNSEEVGNQVPDEDTQLSMRAVDTRSKHGGDKYDEDEVGDGFTLNDALTLNDGITLGDNQTEGDIDGNPTGDIDANTAGAASSFDRRTLTGSIGSPMTFTAQDGVDMEGGVYEREARTSIKFYASPSVESGLSVNSGTLPQVDFDDGSGDGVSTSSY